MKSKKVVSSSNSKDKPVNIKKFNDSVKLPLYAHPGDVGMDVYSQEDYELKPQEKKIFNLLKIYESGIINYLYDYYSPSAIILFGSYSRGEDISTSDIDIGIITPKKNQPELKNFEKKLKRKVNLSLFVKKEVSEEFFTNIINGIVLKGVLK